MVLEQLNALISRENLSKVTGGVISDQLVLRPGEVALNAEELNALKAFFEDSVQQTLQPSISIFNANSVRALKAFLGYLLLREHNDVSVAFVTEDAKEPNISFDIFYKHLSCDKDKVLISALEKLESVVSRK